MITVKEFEREIKKPKKKEESFPTRINFSFHDSGNTLLVEPKGKLDNKGFRGLDPWALACIAEAKEKCNVNTSFIVFEINLEEKDGRFEQNLEAFIRRVSFLSINNKNIRFEVREEKREKRLYDKETLLKRPKNEIIRETIRERSADDKPDLLEKAFQAFLFGKDLNLGTNDRLAIFGIDFYNKKDGPVLREFPTGVFDKEVSKETMLLSTYFVDLVSLNKWGNLSVIELKLNNPGLEVISQILDYGLFFACYRDQLMPIIKKEFGSGQIKKKDIHCYVVNNHFHPRFDKIKKFYNTTNKEYGFHLKKIVLGETTDM